jgi:hypothetical protein
MMQSWPVLRYNPGICLDELRMKHDKPVETVSLLVEESKPGSLEAVVIIQSRPLLSLSTFFWDIMPVSVIEVYRRFGGMYCLHFRGRRVSQ